MSTRRLLLEFASRDDAPRIAQMSRELVETGLGWNYRAATVARLIDDPDTVTLVARESASLVGFAIMSFGDERAHLVLLAVRPQDQRCGVARAMLRWLDESALAAGIASIHVELRAGNTAAVALYQACGFSETVRIPGYYRGVETAIRMIRLLRMPDPTLPVWRPPARNAG